MPKKSLGQNFLKSESFLKKIRDVIDSASAKATAGQSHTPEEITLEIGPGRGALTEHLLTLDNKVIAVEMDGELIEFLKDKFKRYIEIGMLDIIHKDILQFDETVLRNYKLPYRVVGNIPYYITGAIFEKFLSSDYQPTEMTFVIQKEVADRIMTRDGKESILSISVKAYGTPTYHGKIPARYFSPAPKVDSAIIKISTISKNNFTKNNILEKDFFRILKAGFAHKRKKLSSNLKAIFKSEDIKTLFSEMKLSENVRAEELVVGDWIKITQKLTAYLSCEALLGEVGNLNKN